MTNVGLVRSKTSFTRSRSLMSPTQKLTVSVLESLFLIVQCLASSLENTVKSLLFFSFVIRARPRDPVPPKIRIFSLTKLTETHFSEAKGLRDYPITVNLKPSSFGGSVLVDLRSIAQIALCRLETAC